jgi:hypothetical protein
MNSVFHSPLRRLTDRGAGGEGVVSLTFAVFNRCNPQHALQLLESAGNYTCISF